MELFNDSIDLPPNQNFLTKLLSGLISPFRNISKKQWAALVVAALLIISIFITTGLAQKAQKFFSRAASEPGSYGYGSFGSGRYLGFSNIASPSPSVIQSASPVKKPGDTNGDGKVDIFDYNTIVTYFGRTDMTNPEVKKADLNNDNIIDIFDYNLVVSNFGK